jgi:hypothetical protein
MKKMTGEVNPARHSKDSYKARVRKYLLNLAF